MKTRICDCRYLLNGSILLCMFRCLCSIFPKRDIHFSNVSILDNSYFDKDGAFTQPL